jgi:hypothetical protein
MSFIRDMMNIFGYGEGNQTATSVEMEITATIGELLDTMKAEDVPYLDRISMLNKHLENEIIRFNAIEDISETERWKAIAGLREYVGKLNRHFRELQLLSSRK